MPQASVEHSSRVSLRILAAEKALLLRAAVLSRTSLVDFVIRSAVAAAHKLIARAEHGELSERDRLHVLKLLENPPSPNERLRAAARAMPDPA